MLALAFLAIPQSTPAGTLPGAWFEQVQARYQADLEALQSQEQQAVAARTKAEQAQQYALSINDQQALPVAQRAVATAEQALARVRAAIARTRERLLALERVRAASLGTGPAAAVADLRGRVEIQTPAGWVPADPNHVIQPGETIRTGPDGFAEVLFGDGARAVLDANTSFELEKADDAGSRYRLDLGRIKMDFENILHRRLEVRTPVAVAGVRGTAFVMETRSDGATGLAVLKGVVEFGSADGKHRVTVRQGERSILTAGGVPREPAPFDTTRLTAWWEDSP